MRAESTTGALLIRQPAMDEFGDNQVYRTTFCLEDGRFSLGCLDSFRDGWHGGNLTLVDPAGNRLAYCAPNANQR